MRRITVTENSRNWEIEYPDSVVFTFNPLYLIIKTVNDNFSLVMNIICDGVTRSINVEVFRGSSRIYFSRILQLFFEDYKHFRTLDFTVDLKLSGNTIFSTTFMAIWGSLALGDRYNTYGLFSKSGKAEYERTKIWFRNYPFKVSMFSVNLNPPIRCLSDGTSTPYVKLPSLPSGAPVDTEGEWIDSAGNLYQYDSAANEYYIEDVGNCKERGIFDVNPAKIFPDVKSSASLRIGEDSTENVFDETFDYTFYQSVMSIHIVNLIVSNETSGYYLRWIDKHGELQYFLFTKRVISEKNTLSSDTISDMEMVGPMWYPGHNRSAQVTSVKTCKCSAVSLPRNIYEYVSTIVTAPIIDLYLGKSASGREIWVPVRIVAATYDFDTVKPLNDLTLSFTLPEYESQIL